MSDLRLGKVVGGDADEAKVARMWAGIGVRRAARARRANVVRVLAVMAAAAIVVLVAFSLRKPGPLAMHPGAAPNIIELDDGSAITLGSGASVEPVENTGDRFCVLLREGSARFSVQPGGPRRWIVEAGIATVEVVGTVFEVARDASGVHVSVERGVVVVRSERIPNHVHRLSAHESMTVPAELAKVEEAPPPPLASSAPPIVVAPMASASAPPTLDALLDDADRARREGRTEDALSLLARVAVSHDDARAALASFTRAKLELKEPADLAGATRDLERAIARGLPAPLDEEARARLVDVYTRTGRKDDAHRVAAEMHTKTSP